MIGPVWQRWSVRWPKFTVGRLMASVAPIAPFLLILRDDQEGGFLAGALIVGACVGVLACKLGIDAIRRGRPDGEPMDRWQKVGIGLISFIQALVIIGLADYAFLIIYLVVNARIGHPHIVRRRIGYEGLLAGILVVVFASIRLRRAIHRMHEAPALARASDRLPMKIKLDE